MADLFSSYSPYNYVFNSPIRYVDPDGRCPEDGSAGDAGDGDGYCMEEIVVSAEPYNGDVQRIGEPWAAWWFAIRHHPETAFGLDNPIYEYQYFRANGDIYVEDLSRKVNIGIAPTPGKVGKTGGVATGLKDASKALNQLFKNGSIRGQNIIKIRNILAKNGFGKQGLSLNKEGYYFKNTIGEEVRIMRRNGKWRVRVKNRHGNYLDESGNVGSRSETHGIDVNSN